MHGQQNLKKKKVIQSFLTLLKWIVLSAFLKIPNEI